ncbi:MAG: HAD-IIB family hydrolase [Ectothiorhodospiraceae bacterium]|nr:HAD-IIB family hydrolase [Ectothiorhodospiraceae bacterium]
MQKKRKTNPANDGLYIMLVSVHGLVRGHNLELGRDADTGGQIKYVVELARALAEHPAVGQVDLLTRQVFDAKVSDDYAEPMESIHITGFGKPLSDKARIVRIPCGPRRYLRKEVLWPHLDGFVDNVLQHVRRVGQIPDFIHGHYADGGYIATRLAQLLGVPMAFTGHSLGRVKKQRLLAKGLKASNIEAQYNLTQRIEAEEIALGNANLMVTSTHQEVEEQYKIYENYHPRRMTIIPPGVDLSRFHKPRALESVSPMKAVLSRFLDHPKKPMVLAIARPDERKNLATLVRAFGENKKLRDMANLVIIAGNRDDINQLDKGAREVLTQLLLLFDKYDLYGCAAYPKHHESEHIEDLFRMAVKTRGVFVNPALTEPFGLTLIEAAACGLPIVATEDGGPRDIIRLCKNGVLIDPLDADALGKSILSSLSNKRRWNQWSKSGLAGAHKHFSWESHADNYVRIIKRIIDKPRRANHVVTTRNKSRLPILDRILVCDIDNTLLGDDKGLKALLKELKNRRHTNGHHKVGLAFATGRSLESAQDVIKQEKLPVPDFLITSVGSEIHYGHGMLEDDSWTRHIDYRWKPKELRKALINMPGLRLQPGKDQRAHKLSYFINTTKSPSIRDIQAHLRHLDLHAKLIYSHGKFLDLLPVRASKGLAIRYLSIKWGLPPERILVAGDSGNDEEMLRGNTLGLVVGNYSPELARLRGRERVYFAEGEYAWGVLEGIQFYDFLGELVIPGG